MTGSRSAPLAQPATADLSSVQIRAAIPQYPAGPPAHEIRNLIEQLKAEDASCYAPRQEVIVY
jgi:hypothetical protein